MDFFIFNQFYPANLEINCFVRQIFGEINFYLKFITFVLIKLAHIIYE